MEKISPIGLIGLICLIDQMKVIMQFKVPQNIDMEDKIVGPLTLLQFVYLMSGGLIIYIALNTLRNNWFWLIAIPVGLLSLSLAFLKIQDQPFSHFLVSAVLFFVRPKNRVWHKELILEQPHMLKKNIKKEEKKAPPKEGIKKTELEKLSFILDTKGKVEKSD